MTPWGPIGKQVYERTYSRTHPDGTKETWPETVRRAVEGNCDLAPNHVSVAERQKLQELITEFKIMPAGRHLWVSGVQGSQFLFNCHRAGWGGSLADHCGFLFDQLMSGGGVGANYSTAPTYWVHPNNIEVVCSPQHPDFADCETVGAFKKNGDSPHSLIVEDSREGWVDALRLLLDRSTTITNGTHPTTIDVSNVRSKGAPIKGFGGISAGPSCLVKMLLTVRDLLNQIASKQHIRQHLSRLDLMRIDHAIAECVIAGNIRRSARMSILHWQDSDINDFLGCKQQDGEHWSTNISVEVDDQFWDYAQREGSEARELLAFIAEGMRTNGEPGIFNSHLASVGETADVRATNPCGEIALQEWEPCNLGHLNMAKLQGEKERHMAAVLMARFLIRATCSPDVNELQKPVLERNRRIGVGLYGLHSWLMQSESCRYSDINRNPHIAARVGAKLRELRRSVTDEAAMYAAQMSIPKPIKTTTVAPTGSISSLSGDTAGVHPLLAKRFIRRVRYSNDDPALEGFLDTAKERCEFSANTTVVSMLCEDPLLRTTSPKMLEDVSELGICDQMAMQRLVQDNWADNAVSFTVAIPEKSTSDDVMRALLKWGPLLKGTTMFPTLTRAQQPIEPLTSEQAQMLVAELGPSQFGNPESDCMSGACPVK